MGQEEWKQEDKSSISVRMTVEQSGGVAFASRAQTGACGRSDNGDERSMQRRTKEHTRRVTETHDDSSPLVRRSAVPQAACIASA